MSITWHIEKRKVSDLKLNPINPRKISDAQLAKLKERIITRGFHDVIKIDVDDTILSGNQRKRVLMDLGIVEVDCLIPDRQLTEEERRAVLLESNRSDGEWDWKGLAEFDEDLIAQIGFSATEIDRIFDLKTGEDEGLKVDENVEVITKRDDLYVLGSHRLLCGDSTNESDMIRLMDGQLADLIFTDPPYMVDYKSQSGRSYHSSAFGGDGKKIFSDDLDQKNAKDFYFKVAKNLFDFSKESTPIYWWFATRNHIINQEALELAGWLFSQQIFWVKERMVFSKGQDFHRCYEPCIYGWKKGKKHYISKEIATYREIWMDSSKEEFSDYLDLWFEKRDVTQDYIHPTQKPVQLAERALRKSSKQDDIVLDLFGGSGSTMMACEQMHRRCFSMELDPKFCDAIVNRWEKFTGLKAVKYGSDASTE